MSHTIAITYQETCDVVEHLGILPLSSFMPGHPSLVSITRPDAWHTGMDSDPWLWRDRFAIEGIAAYGRFLGDKPLLISQELFPIVHCLLAQAETVEERYAAGLLAKSTLRIYNCIRENDDIDVRTLRKLTGMQHSSDKSAFDRSLNELQNTAEVVISGISERLNPQGNKSGWNSTCYLLADTWMERHGIVNAQLSSAQAKTKLYAWIEQRWEASAVQYLKKRWA
ncbi:MAG: AlkZ-related protein [Ktedonobacteraceae bacterium]